MSMLQEAEQMLAGVGEMGADTLHAALTKFGVVAPDTKNPISSPFPFNLMFKTSIGPRGDLVGYLRPETAQVRRGVLVALPPLLVLLINFKLLGQHVALCPFMCRYMRRINLLLSFKTAQQGSCSLLAVLGSEVVQVLHQCLLCPQLVEASYHTLTR
jgi:hypothetical protein